MASSKSKFKISFGGFTILELLIVIGVIVVLSMAVILELDPAELLAKARDTERMADLQGINKALSLMSKDSPGFSLGASSTVYVSLVDAASSTCGSLNLPSLPYGWIYHCVSQADDLKKSNGTGWLPVDFNASNSVISFASLPADPINSTEAGRYYTYSVSSQNSWKLSSALESQDRQKEMRGDGGLNYFRYEIGSDLSLQPSEPGLLAYYKFEEGTGDVINDSSGNRRGGMTYFGPTFSSDAKDGLYAMQFNGGGFALANMPGVLPAGSQARTIVAWIKPLDSFDLPGIVGWGSGDCFSLQSYIGRYSGNNLFAWGGCNDGLSSFVVPQDQWSFAALSYAAGNTEADLYLNDQKETVSFPSILNTPATNNLIIGCSSTDDGASCGSGSFNGLIDEVRIYNRDLEEEEVLLLYNASK